MTEEEQTTQKAILLFNKWDPSEVVIKDPGLERYVTIQSMAVPHSCGRLTQQQFTKSGMAIVERLINRLMQVEHNTGKKQLCTRIVMDSFDIIHAKTKQNPIQVLIDAIGNTGPREETVRLKYGGINVPKSVDTAPIRRVNTALKYIATGVWRGSHKTKRSVSQVLADELIAASKGDSKCFSVGKKEEVERIAKSAR
ncbi:MAG: 30S ribosomal protein S7 [Methanocalculus sp. MSAO_Arc1]|uniref:30S ribosomal protein S7 n=1 Tax=Methanocalculus TaxID=71151 RepID=UPI000FF41362|nr:MULTISPECIES: 30S ribosomal protein S7 [unclassified Methanocalculus]MCP1662666.1 small subunit ribosomal protein S7 [Methanocalculus sp. AMF5]RQD80303.1 MAG: 30S ribosomal protein S7 [Methanocalculus sp. MSAO_Arc1]